MRVGRLGSMRRCTLLVRAHGGPPNARRMRAVRACAFSRAARTGKDKASQLDISIPFRLTGIPNNGVLDLVRLPAGAPRRAASWRSRQVIKRGWGVAAQAAGAAASCESPYRYAIPTTAQTSTAGGVLTPRAAALGGARCCGRGPRDDPASSS